MKILALDSSGLVASVAIVEDGVMRAEYTINYKKTHSQTLLPMLDEIVQMTETELNTIDVIAVAGGPGSFTGLRIGSATAKGLGLALEKPLISVPTVQGLAYNYQGFTQIICPIMDARRGQVYTGVYRFDGNECITLQEQCAVAIEELMSILEGLLRADSGLPNQVVFLGDGVCVHQMYIEEYMRSSELEASFAPAHMNGQRAGAIAMCAARLYQAGKAETAAEHRPDYLRLSQAERERAEREKTDREKTECGQQ